MLKRMIDSIGRLFGWTDRKDQKLDPQNILEDVGPEEARAFVQAPAIGSKTQFWYGRVNYWADTGALQRKEVEFMRKIGLTGYIIEMAGNGGDAMRKSRSSSEYQKWVSRIETYYKHLHNLCRENGIWLFVCIVNDNALSSKHGNRAVDPKHYYNDVATDLLNIVLKDGTGNILVQPVSELYSARVKNHPGVAWMKNAIVKLKAAGFKTCNNDSYGRPSGLGGCSHMAWHPNRIDHLPDTRKINKATCLIVSDTGGIISELNGGTNCDKVDANCKPGKIKEWRKKVNGFAVCGYYDYKRKSFNEAAIKAMAGK